MLRAGSTSIRLDHVAFAVWDPARAAGFWGDLLGGEYRQGNPDWSGFAFLQFAYGGDARIEILSPGSDPDGFVVRFLRRYGEGVHHLTFVVDDLPATVRHLREAGHHVFGESYADPHWHEAFVSAGLQGSRVLVQLAASDLSPEEQDEHYGGVPLRSVLEAAAGRPAPG